MAYMLLILEDPRQRGTRSRPQGEAVYQRMVQFAEELRERRVLLAVESLASHERATRVSIRGAQSHLVDGPFAEAKEMVGGFFLLDCATREEAVALASLCPAAEWATVEVRETGPCFV